MHIGFLQASCRIVRGFGLILLFVAVVACGLGLQACCETL